MMSKSKRFVSFLCALVVLISSYAGYVLPFQVNAAVASNPVSSELQLDTKYDTFENTDITVMSYNVLAHNASDSTYEHQSTRKEKVVKMIETYNPDVIGIQEAAVETDLDWATYLTTELSKLGYGVYRRATSMTIGNGLMIFYKTSRFSEVNDQGTKEDGSEAFKGSILYGTDTTIGATTSQKRYFQWIMLKDKVTGQQFMVYNTHFSVLSADEGGHTEREKEAKELVKHIAAWKGTIPDRCKATMYPIFVTGDFNADFTGKFKPTMATLHDKEFLDDAATVADYTRFTDPKEEIDHIFVNPKYVHVKEYHVAVENVGERRTSDHSPHIAYCNFKADATINGVDTKNKTFTAETNTNSYTLEIALGARAGFKLYSEDGAELASNNGEHNGITDSPVLTLNKAINRFTIKFFDGGHSNQSDASFGKYISTVEVIIKNTSKSTSFAPSGVVNSYFSNGAYHVLANASTSTLPLSSAGATFYATANASGSAVTSVTLSEGRTVRYLKTTAGDIYPVYIYKQTATANADSSVFYVDDDIGNATGTVAYYDGKDVIFIQGGTKGFSTVAEVASKTTDGATVYFAPGKYISDNVVFNKNITLLGNNYNVSPINKIKPNWLLASRNEESVIDGGLIFKNQSNISVTVKGFTFAGKSNNGPICIDDETSDTATLITHVQTIDIQNNIFTGGGNGSVNGASALCAYSGAQVKGLVKNNYFRCTINQKGNADSDWVAGQTRGLSIKNANGLAIDSNYFRGYELLGDFTDYISSAVAGNLNYAFSENRFEHCGTIRSAIKNIQSNTSANIAYYNNDVVRCGPGRRQSSLFFTDFNFSEDGSGNVCSNIAITIYGNRFTDCYRVFRLKRAINGQQGNLAEMTFAMNKNQFINPTEGNLSGHEFFIGRFDFYLDSSNTKEQPFPEKWDISGNIYESKFYEDDIVETTCKNAVNASLTNTNHTEAARTMRKYYLGIKELDFIWNLTSEDKTVQQRPLAIDASVFEAKEEKDYYTRADELSEALNKATGVTPDKDEFYYDFNDDITGANLLGNEIASIKDKMIPGTNSSSDTITITANKTLELKGRTSFYTENRWDSTGQVAFDLKTTSTLVDSKRSAFHFKFGHWLSFVNRALQNSDFYTGSNIEGCILTFATKAEGGPTVKLFVYYKTAGGKKAAAEYEFNNIVTSFTEFNTFKLVEAETGMLDLYANGKRFARLECYDSTSTYAMRAVATTADSYYDNIDVYAVENGTLVKKGNTITDTLVTKDTAIAFATSNSTVNDSTSATYGQTMEIDNLLITSSVDVVEEPETPTPDDPTDEPEDEPVTPIDGTITISNAQNGVKYSAFKMANVTYNAASDAYAYKVAPGWENFFNGSAGYEKVAEVFSVQGGYIIRKNPDEGPSTETMQEIARLAIQYAQANGIAAAGTATAQNGQAVISVDAAGYYVVDSALGTLLSIGTFNGAGENPNVDIAEKNTVPTLEKYVKEGNTWKVVNDASIGSTVEFKILINVSKGATGYILNDTLAAGFRGLSITSINQYASKSAYEAGTVKATYAVNTNYTITQGTDAGKDYFVIAFNDATIAAAGEGSVIEILYTAIVDTDATIDTAPNVNTAYLMFGETQVAGDTSTLTQQRTVDKITNTYAWSFGINKFYNKNSVATPLAGAQFKLYKENPITNPNAVALKFVYDAQIGYRLADTSKDTSGVSEIITSTTSGNDRVLGLDNITYYLVETQAPAGYNKLGAPIVVTISSSQVANAETQLVKQVTANQGAMSGDIIPVLNQTGLVLPSTGGYTQIFIIVGCMMVMSMGTLLVVRKRMTKVVYIRNDFYDDEEYED